MSDRGVSGHLNRLRTSGFVAARRPRTGPAGGDGKGGLR